MLCIMCPMSTNFSLINWSIRMAGKLTLAGNEVRRLKKDREDCHAIREDFQKAKLAGVPNLEELESKIDYLIERIDKLLALNGVE